MAVGIGSTQSTSRFMNSEAKAQKRRYFRLYRRKQRRASLKTVLKRPAAGGVVPSQHLKVNKAIGKVKRRPSAGGGVPSHSIRTKSRHRLYPCCGKRKDRCQCDFGGAAKMCNASALREFKVYLTSASLLTVADTTDASYFTELYSPGCERDGVTLERLWFLAAAFRHVNRVTTWEAVKDHFATRGTPDWSAVLSALRTLKASGVPLASGVFYPAQLKEYRWSPKQSWKTASGMAMPDKIALTWQVMWSAVPRTEIRSHVRKPSRETFKACYDAWKTKMDDLTRGMFGAYFIKCMLDLLCFTGHIEDRHLSCWPSECGGYTPALTKLFGPVASTKSLRLQLMWWLYQAYGGSCHGGKFCFAAFSMHLCWWKRSTAA